MLYQVQRDKRFESDRIEKVHLSTRHLLSSVLAQNFWYCNTLGTPLEYAPQAM